MWASLLSGWSLVFDKMLNSEGFLERQQAQVVISDFSSGAVEIFLRCLYSGVVRGPLETLVEVSSMADKYQVKRLPELCTEALQEGLSPANACQLFAAAARFQPQNGAGGDLDQRCRSTDRVPEHKSRTARGDPAALPHLHDQLRAADPLARMELQGAKSWCRRDFALTAAADH